MIRVLGESEVTMSNTTYIVHSSKGQTWKDHKYLRIENGRYIYPTTAPASGLAGTNVNTSNYSIVTGPASPHNPGQPHHEAITNDKPKLDLGTRSEMEAEIAKQKQNNSFTGYQEWKKKDDAANAKINAAKEAERQKANNNVNSYMNSWQYQKIKEQVESARQKRNNDSSSYASQRKVGDTNNTVSSYLLSKTKVSGTPDGYIERVNKLINATNVKASTFLSYNKVDATDTKEKVSASQNNLGDPKKMTNVYVTHYEGKAEQFLNKLGNTISDAIDSKTTVLKANANSFIAKTKNNVNTWTKQTKDKIRNLFTFK